MGKLDGKVAIVTGAGGGLGREHSLLLAKEGASVVVNDLGGARDGTGAGTSMADGVVDEIKAAGGSAVANYGSVTDDGAAAGMVKSAMDNFGRIDILVNNAGVTRDNLLMRMSEEEWDTVIDTNLKGAFNFTKALTRPFIKQRSGRIINIASVIGLIGNAGQSNYAASKAALIGFTKSIAKELATRGITVNAIAPGFIETDMTAALSEKMRESILGNVPLERFGSPDDIAHAAVFLAMEPSGYITGQVHPVDGGMVM